MTRHAPRIQSCKNGEPLHNQALAETSEQHSGNDERLKAKQQCESGMRRTGSGNLRNLPKLRLVSRLLLYSLARRLAQTAPIVSRLVKSCLPSSARLPNRTLLPELATEGPRHQLRW